MTGPLAIGITKAPAILVQLPTAAPQFEVISIKPADPSAAGLDLSRRKVPVAVPVIDHVEKPVQ